MSEFDKGFPQDLKDELEARENFVRDKQVDWNYDKYAFIRVRSTGESGTVILPGPGPLMTLGDGLNLDAPIDLYTTQEGGIRKFKPTLNSVKITNQGGQDYTDSYIYEVEFSFTVYTMNDLNSAEENFFRVGSEIEFDFGWKGRQQAGCRGTVKANVFNFDFSMNEDGSFSCNVKCMSPAGLWAGDDIGGTSEVEDVDDEEEVGNFLHCLEISCRAAFGLDSDDEADDVSKLGDNKVRFERKYLKSDKKEIGNIFGLFGAAEIIIKPSWINDEEQYVFYTNLDTLIQFIDAMSKYEGDDKTNSYSIASGKIGSYPKIPGIGSSDPQKFFLPGNQGSYGRSGDGGNSKNFSQWGSKLNSASRRNKFDGDIAKIAISLKFLTETYDRLSKDAPTISGYKQSVKVADFLKEIFAELDVKTGGLISLAAVPTKDGEPLTPENQEAPLNIMILNKKMVSNKAKATGPEPHIFEVLSKKSIVKSVSLSSDFDADYMLMATPANIEKGTSNGHYLVKDPHGGPFPGKVVKPGKDAEKSETDLKKMREDIGEKGASEEKLTAYGDACKNFILRKAKENGQLSEGRYSEIIYTLNLSLTIDGIWGIPFLAPIKIDRLPAIFKGDDIVFSITAVNHEFDCKGGWETSLETVMRIV